MSGVTALLSAFTQPVAGGGGGIEILNNWKNTASGASMTVTVSPTSGNRLVVLVASDATSYTVSDNLSTSYTATPTKDGFGIIVGQNISAAVGSGVTTVTITPAASAYMQCFVYEVVGLSGGYTTGEYGDNFFAGDTAWISGNATTATADSILFFIATAATSNETTTFSAYTNGFASFGANSWYGTGSSGLATVTAYKIVSATATHSTAVTSSHAGNGVSLLAAFN